MTGHSQLSFPQPPALAESLRARHGVPPELPPALVAARADSLKRLGIDPTTRPRTPSVTRFQNERANAELLIRSGCTIAVASDDMVPSPASSTQHEMGSVFLSGVEGLVEEGMTPAQALVANLERRPGRRAGSGDRIDRRWEAG